MTVQHDAKHQVVLVALDGSPAAATALPVARSVAEQLGATLEILHALGRPATHAAGRFGVGREELADAVVREPCGDPAAAILQAAADPDVALVVLTMHGRGIEPGRELGGVAEAVIAGANQPILLVRPEAGGWPAGAISRLRHILLPLDGTPSTAMALQPVTELAARLVAAVDLLYVVDPGQATPGEAGTLTAPRYVDQPHHEWPQWANEVAARLGKLCAHCPPEVPLRVFLAIGEAGIEVVQFARTHEEDAIALVRRSSFEPGRARTLRTILGQTPCPVLLVGGTPR